VGAEVRDARQRCKDDNKAPEPDPTPMCISKHRSSGKDDAGWAGLAMIRVCGGLAYYLWRHARVTR
jgi:hypothetical protein